MRLILRHCPGKTRKHVLIAEAIFLKDKDHAQPRKKRAQNAVNKTILLNNVEAKTGTRERAKNLRKVDGNCDL